MASTAPTPTSPAVHWTRSIVEPSYDWNGRDAPVPTGFGFIRRSEDADAVEASVDGVHWEAAWRTNGFLSRLGVFSGGFLAMGYAQSAGNNPAALAAYSADGLDWVQSTGQAELNGLMIDFVENNGVVVVVGLRGPLTDIGAPQWPSVWITTAP